MSTCYSLRRAISGLGPFLLGSLLCLTTGCTDLDSPNDVRARANLDHWSALDTTLREVNASRLQGPVAQLEAIRLGIETLDRLPTDYIDEELLELNASLRLLLDETRSHVAANAPLAADPTDHPGPLADEESALVEEGIRVQLLLTERYDINFPRIFDRSEQFDQQGQPVQTIGPADTIPVQTVDPSDTAPVAPTTVPQTDFFNEPG